MTKIKKKKKYNVKSRIIACLRNLWMKSPIRYEAIKNARVERGKYQCVLCKELFKVKEMNVDHADPIGGWADYNQFVERLFCPVENLQCLCKPCHEVKTLKERERRAELKKKDNLNKDSDPQ